MPNIKSAEKRVKIIEKKTLRNNMVKSGYRTAVKKFELAVANGEKDLDKLFQDAVKKVDQACSKGVIKANTASRKKSRLAKLLNSAK
ncbi:MAG: 30S ribosomal protein S20 [Clostridia bacterium]|nr:30S ribosomal protein S20 [Clostridia bacterium]